MLSEIKHPFIIRIIGWSQNMDELLLILEYIQGGELFTFLKLNDVLDDIKTIF